ncbi:MAG: hypothetical protein GC193_13240 [Cryomorphaceae bacterium]|nr:hypothetical protein [Cryomorphaceae bacterium]
MMSRILTILFLLPFAGMAQDTLKVEEIDFLKQLLRYHPQLGIRTMDVGIAEAEAMGARAAFDPNLKGEYASKTFDGTSYYDYRDAALEWQLQPGINLKAGYNRSIGTYINPETFTPEVGLAFAEISVPLVDGFFRTPDQTRLRQARISADRSVRTLENAQRDMVLFGAEVYWNWVAASRALKLRNDIVALALERYNQTVGQYQLGVFTAMDTLEAHNQYVKRQTEYTEALMDFQEWFRLAGTLIWENDMFDQFTGGAEPDTSWQSAADLHISRALSNDLTWLHPSVEMLELKSREARLDLLLAREQLKPDVNLSLKAISRADQLSLAGNNSVIGLSAKVPILSRKERANIRKAQFKLDQADLYVDMKLRDLMQKRLMLESQVLQVNDLSRLARENAANAGELLFMEGTKLRLGESTLFIINRRENTYLDAAIKEIDVMRKKRILEWKMILLTYNPQGIIEN